MSAADLVDEVVEEVRALDEDVVRWEAGERDAGSTALATTSLLIVKLHRVHDELTREIRRHDRQHKPYNERD